MKWIKYELGSECKYTAASVSLKGWALLGASVAARSS